MRPKHWTTAIGTSHVRNEWIGNEVFLQLGDVVIIDEGPQNAGVRSILPVFALLKLVNLLLRRSNEGRRALISHLLGYAGIVQMLHVLLLVFLVDLLFVKILELTKVTLLV